MSSTALVARVRQVVTQMDPQVPIADVLPMEIVVANSMSQTSFTMLLLLIAAGIALVLSAVGIYGVISYVVGQRRTEIGIRMALGAQVAEVSRMIVAQSLTLASAGVIVGHRRVGCGHDGCSARCFFEVSPTRSVRSCGNGGDAARDVSCSPALAQRVARRRSTRSRQCDSLRDRGSHLSAYHLTAVDRLWTETIG